MDTADDKITTSTTRRTEDGTSESQDDTFGEGGIGTVSPNLGSISQRVRGASSPQQGPIPGHTTNGKILTQMIQDCDDRLEEAEACLQWYQNVKERELKRRANLLKLQEEEEQERQKQQTETES